MQFPPLLKVAPVEHPESAGVLTPKIKENDQLLTAQLNPNPPQAAAAPGNIF